MTQPAPAPLSWFFPLARPLTGAPLGNAIQGLLVWGERSLFITVARAGFWDRRGGQGIPSSTTFKRVRRALETDDEAALNTLFPSRAPGAAFPQQMGGGRFELTFADGLRPLDATLDLATAELSVRVGRHEDDSAAQTLVIRQDTSAELAWIDAPPALLAATDIRLRPAFELVKEDSMRALGIAPPVSWSDAGGGGFLQTLPADEPLAVAWARQPGRLLIATALGNGAEATVRARLQAFDAAAADAARLAFWTRYWADAARVHLPDPVLQRQYDYALYRQPGILRAGAPAGTLQGPWMEDTVIPPWSNDYHFNINVQLVYSAALATGQDEHMRPLWDMLRGWLPRLRELGEAFYQRPGALLIPHAVDDRCQLLGVFWAGVIDQACVAWMGHIAYQYYRYTGDKEHLRELAWPLLVGAFEGYHAALELVADAEGRRRYSLPVSVSPEFGGSERHECWGRDASFQLAALHATVRALREAAPVLGRPEDPRWADVATHLPPYTLVDSNTGSYGWVAGPSKRIALWEGKDLNESHRHHSHLGAIHPFCTIDPFAPEHHPIIARTINRWSVMGPGNWTGWCLPWASMICTRCGLPDAARGWLHVLANQFTNVGYATVHNSDDAGMFGWDDGSLAWPDHRKGPDYIHYEISELDAPLGAATAILEMLVTCRGDTVRIADRLPKHWRELSFQRIRTEGGFELSGTFRHGRVASLTVVSPRGGTLRLEHQLGPTWTLDGVACAEPLLVVNTAPGQIFHLAAS